MARKSNFPTNDLGNLPKEWTGETISNLMQLYNKGRPQSDDELKVRLDEFFELCDNSSIRPGIESLRLALSVSRQTLLNWENGINCSSQRQELIVKAKTFVIAFLEQSMLNNKIFPGSGIFFLKNLANYRDNVEIIACENNSMNSGPSREEIAARFRAQTEFQDAPNAVLDVDDL